MAHSDKKSSGGFMRNWLDRFNNLRPAVRQRRKPGLDRGVSLLNIRPPDSFFPLRGKSSESVAAALSSYISMQGIPKIIFSQKQNKKTESTEAHSSNSKSIEA